VCFFGFGGISAYTGLNCILNSNCIFAVFARKAPFHRPSSSSELTEAMTDEPADNADADSIMQPLYRLIFEVFELTGIFKWLPRTLVSLVQVAYGKSISRFLSLYLFSIHLLMLFCSNTVLSANSFNIFYNI